MFRISEIAGYRKIAFAQLNRIQYLCRKQIRTFADVPAVIVDGDERGILRETHWIQRARRRLAPSGFAASVGALQGAQAHSSGSVACEGTQCVSRSIPRSSPSTITAGTSAKAQEPKDGAKAYACMRDYLNFAVSGPYIQPPHGQHQQYD